MIEDWNETNTNTITEAIAERWKDYQAELQFADIELRLYPDDRELTLCPAVIWEKDGCNFVIIKVAENKYQNKFFYSGKKQFGTGIENYDSLYTCVITLLQVQADYLNTDYHE